MYGGSVQDDLRLLGIPDTCSGSFTGPEDFEIWAENWPALELFSSLGTQWRVGMAGPTGLDYAVIPALFELHGVEGDKRRELFDLVRVMENAALDVMATKRKK